MLGLKQPFSDVRPVPTVEEVVDKAFRRARRGCQTPPKTLPPHVRVRIREQSRVRIAAQVMASALDRILRDFPRVDSVHPFYRELADVLVGVDVLRKSLGAVKWARDSVRRIGDMYASKLRGARTVSDAGRLRREAYGRMVSILKQVSENLDFLREARDRLVRLPSIDPEKPTVIVAGYANVGKSTFVKSVSTAKPEVAPYPFTTKGVVVGHRETEVGVVQIVDTPGLLDRPLSRRNRIELQAIAAIKHLPGVIVFLLDPTETCGYKVESQLRLLDEIREMFGEKPTIVAANKGDVMKPGDLEKVEERLGEVPVISALKGEGVEELLKKALEALRPSPSG